MVEHQQIKTTDGHDTDLVVSLVTLHDGGFQVAVITDKDDEVAITVYEDEIQPLIDALEKIKGDLK